MPGLLSPGPGTLSEPEGPCRRRLAGAGGVAGPAPDVRHQPQGDVHPQFCIQHTDNMYKRYIASTLVAQWYREPSTVQQIKGSNPVIMHFFTFYLFRLILRLTELYQDILVYLAIHKVYLSIYMYLQRYEQIHFNTGIYHDIRVSA